MLVGNGLAVDHETDLRVIPQGMKEAVAVGGHASGAVDDGIAQTSAGIDDRQLTDEALIRIHVRGRVHLQHIRAPGLDGNCRARAGHCQARLDLHGHGVADGDVLSKSVEPGSCHFQVIRVGRDVSQAERPVIARGGGLRIAGDRIMNRNCRLRDRCAGGVQHRSLDGTGVTK